MRNLRIDRVRKEAVWQLAEYCAGGYNHLGYFVLIPVPEALSVRNQVINPDTGEHYKTASVMPIELLFHDVPGLENRLCDDASRPGNFRRLRGSKTGFAQNTV